MDSLDEVSELRAVVTDLENEAHIMREEMSGLRQMLEGVTSAMTGAQRAYAAVSQRADLLDTRIKRLQATKFA